MSGKNRTAQTVGGDYFQKKLVLCLNRRGDWTVVVLHFSGWVMFSPYFEMFSVFFSFLFLSLLFRTQHCQPSVFFLVILLQNTFFFMNTESFEEIAVDKKIMEDKNDWIEEGMEVQLVFFKDGVIEVVLPGTTTYQIAETDPNMKGNTAQGYTKPATLSCGAVINIPGYLEQGEFIKVDTEKKMFLERANK
jgi:hypothetical protein